MIRKLYALLISLFLLVVLVGCGTSNNSTSNSGGSESGDGTTTISFYTWINEENGNWEKTIAAFEEAHPDIKVDLNVLVENMSTDDYEQKLDLLAASNEEMDVIMLGNAKEVLAKRISAGMVSPLNDLIEAEGLDVYEEYNMQPAPATSKGEIYGLPGKFNIHLVMINKDHLDEAGLEVPTDWTWDDYREYAKAMTTDEHYGSYFHTWPTIWQVLKLSGKPENIWLIKEDGSSNLDDPMVAESLELRYNLEHVDKSSMPYANIISQQLNYRQEFFTQKASMIPILSYMLTEWGGFEPDFTITWAPWPKNSEDGPISAETSADIYSIGSNSKNREAAYKFIRWMTTEGMLVQNKSIPAWKNVELNEVLTNLAQNTAKPDAIDLDALNYVLEVSEPSKQFLPAGYLEEVYNQYNAAAEKYLLGEQELDETLEEAKEAVENVIKMNQ